MRVNGKERCRGLDDLAQHSRDIQAKKPNGGHRLPFIDEFCLADGDRIFTHHFVRAREPAKTAANGSWATPPSKTKDRLDHLSACRIRRRAAPEEEMI